MGGDGTSLEPARVHGITANSRQHVGPVAARVLEEEKKERRRKVKRLRERREEREREGSSYLQPLVEAQRLAHCVASAVLARTLFDRSPPP